MSQGSFSKKGSSPSNPWLANFAERRILRTAHRQTKNTSIDTQTTDAREQANEAAVAIAERARARDQQARVMPRDLSFIIMGFGLRQR